MSDTDRIPASAALVLRDRTNADPQQVFAAALDDLIALGVWTHRTTRRPRRADELRPAADAAPAALPEPLRTVDALLRRATGALGVPLRTKTLGVWLASAGAATPSVAVRRAIEDLVARGLLERRGAQLGPSAAGVAALAALPDLPPRANLASGHEDVRATSLKLLSPLGNRLLRTVAGTRTGARGFAYGTDGADGDYARSPNGEARDAAVRYGWGAY